MNTVSDTRVEKRVKELVAEKKAAKMEALKLEIKEYKIRAEKTRIIECLNQNFYLNAANAMNRLTELTKD